MYVLIFRRKFPSTKPHLPVPCSLPLYRILDWILMHNCYILGILPVFQYLPVFYQYSYKISFQNPIESYEDPASICIALAVFYISLYVSHITVLRGGPLEIPGGGWKFPQKNSCKEKCLEKKFVQPLRQSQRKKNRASKQQSVNSFEKKFLQRVYA